MLKKREVQKKADDFRRYLQESERQSQLKKQLEQEERILKKLLNIEEEHKKHCLIIENGVKKEFKIKLRDNRYKATVGMEYSFKLPDLIKLIATRKDKKKDL